MIGMVIFVTICLAGVAFLVHVLIALCRESGMRLPIRKKHSQRFPIVVQLPSDPIFTAGAIRPAGVPDNTPFSIVKHDNGATAEFYGEEGGTERDRSERWGVFVNPRRLRAKKVM